MPDELDFFDELTARRQKVDDEPDYPGRTPPRNRGKKAPAVDTTPEDWLAGVPVRQFYLDGAVREFYTIGSLAKILDLSQVTIRSWEDKGWLPSASFRSPAPVKAQIPGRPAMGKRLYTKEQVICLVTGYRLFIKTPEKPDWPAFREYIKTEYTK